MSTVVLATASALRSSCLLGKVVNEQTSTISNIFRAVLNTASLGVAMIQAMAWGAHSTLAAGGIAVVSVISLGIAGKKENIDSRSLNRISKGEFIYSRCIEVASYVANIGLAYLTFRATHLIVLPAIEAGLASVGLLYRVVKDISTFIK